jgi:hypothetical protein
LTQVQKNIRARPWYISSAELTHINCTSQPKPSAKQLATLPTVVSAVGANPAIRGKALIQQVQSTDAINTSGIKRTMYRAMDMVKKEVMGGLEEGYKKLPGFLADFARQNPGAIATLEQHSDHRFRRACVVPGVLAHASFGNQRILGIDGGHSKHPRYHGLQLLLVGRDGNFKNVNLAVALVESESQDEYDWFLGHCTSAGMNLQVPSFFRPKHWFPSYSRSPGA